MKKISATILIAILALNVQAHAEDISQGAQDEIQLDSYFESSENDQLKSDRNYMANEAVTTQKEVVSEKGRIKNLQRQNEKLNNDIQKHTRLIQERRSEANKLTNQANRIEKTVSNQEQQLEKLKIRNVELRKNIELAQERIRKANAAAKAIAAKKAQAERERKNLLAKRSNLKRRT